MGTYNTGKQNKEKKSPGAWDILTDSLSLRVTYTKMKNLFFQSGLVFPQF